jgi:hypothetical protein
VSARGEEGEQGAGHGRLILEVSVGLVRRVTSKNRRSTALVVRAALR